METELSKPLVAEQKSRKIKLKQRTRIIGMMERALRFKLNMSFLAGYCKFHVNFSH